MGICLFDQVLYIYDAVTAAYYHATRHLLQAND